MKFTNKEKVIAKEMQEQMDCVLVKAGSFNKQESLDATREIAKAIELPLRQSILNGEILDGIFEPIKVSGRSTVEFPLDIIAPGQEKEFVAYTLPNQGYIPSKAVEGDYVMVPTYSVGNGIEWGLKYARDARWDIIGRATDVFRAGFVKKMNDDGWHTIIVAGYDRNIIVVDSDAAAGVFTKRLVSLGKTVMRRNGGGNSTSMNRGQLTDLYISPEAMEDIRNWNVDQLDETTRRQIFTAEGDNALNRIFGVNLHTIDELGEGQEYQLFYGTDLGATMPGGKVEIAVGLDLRKNDSFVMPVVEELQIFEDDTLHRSQRGGIYGWQESGLACLDGRRVCLLGL
jgi:hypothetical protein